MFRIVRFTLVALVVIFFPRPGTVSATASASSQIKHVIVITIDNTHLEEILQMPHLMTFLRQGTLFDNDQSVLESWTQADMISFLSGAYPDKTGITHNHVLDRGYSIDNWGYWENRLYVHTDNGKADVDMGHPFVEVPNPWQQFNDHGWDVGVARAANMSLEDLAEPRQYNVMNASDKDRGHYIRYAIHCALGSSNCAGASKQTPPNTLFGSPNMPWLYNAPLLDGSGKVGPGCYNCFDALRSLSATYAMQAHGIPVTYSYVDASHGSFDPNSAPHRQTLANNDHAFALFFSKLAGIGITPANTLFAITSDEGDHFSPGREQNYGLLGWLNTGTYNFVPANFQIVDGSSPLVYMKDTADIPYALESLGAVRHWEYLANATGLTAIHAASYTNPALAARAPSFAIFGEADTWWNGSGDAAYIRDVTFQHAKWDHGTISPDVNTTWLAFVGPGVRTQELGTFVDHVDALPTIDYLLGYPIPSYTDGRILFEVLPPSVLPSGVAANAPKILQLADAYKQINAPLGDFAMAALRMSTGACLRATTAQGKADDAHLARLVVERNQLASDLQATVDGAVQGAPLDTSHAETLLVRYNALMREISG